MPAFIFDFDGTLVDTEPIHERALAAACAPYGVPIEPGASIGLSDEDAVAQAFGAAGQPLGRHRRDAICREKVSRYVELVSGVEVVAYEGAVEAVLAAGRLGPVALCTAAMRTEVAAVVGRLGLADAFDAVVAADDVEAKKPDPAAYRLAMQRLGVAGGVAIEDSPRGVASASGAGCLVIAVEHTTPRDQLGGADLVVGRIAEVEISRATLEAARKKTPA